VNVHFDQTKRTNDQRNATKQAAQPLPQWITGITRKTSQVSQKTPNRRNDRFPNNPQARRQKVVTDERDETKDQRRDDSGQNRPQTREKDKDDQQERDADDGERRVDVLSHAFVERGLFVHGVYLDADGRFVTVVIWFAVLWYPARRLFAVNLHRL
jgi:hypothetical protein